MLQFFPSRFITQEESDTIAPMARNGKEGNCMVQALVFVYLCAASLLHSCRFTTFMSFIYPLSVIVVSVTSLFEDSP